MRLLRTGLGLAAALALPLAAAGAAAAAGSSPAGAPAHLLAAASSAGACTTDEGVTVVVDLTALDGSIVIRCVAGPVGSGYTGWDALTDAGFNPQAAARQPGFVCRLSGEPSASRGMDIPEGSDYHEQCVNTPPQSAYWGYWYSTNGGSWTYSDTGAANRRVIEGGYEGWAFALNSHGNAPKPRVAPSHPVATPKPTQPGGGGGQHSSGGRPSGGPTSSPTTTPPPTTATTRPGAQDSKRGHRREGQPEHPRGSGPSASAEPPTVATTTSAAEPQVTGELPDQPDDSAGSATPTVIGVVLLALLAAGAGVTAWRRSHRG